MRLREMRRYRRDDPHSYALGTFCVLELLDRAPEHALRVVLEPSAESTPGARLVRAAAERAGVPVDSDARVPAALSSKENVHAVAAFAKYEAPVGPGGDHVVLVRPADFGNLGTVVRTMRGLGAGDLVLVPPAADLFDPRVVRASMGALFGLRFSVVADLTSYADAFDRPLYAFRSDAARPLPTAAFTRPAALVFGPESSGLLDSDVPPASRLTSVAIPQDPAIDSFNLATSVALGLWELRRSTGSLPAPTTPTTRRRDRRPDHLTA